MNLICRAALVSWLLFSVPGCNSGPDIVPVKGIATRHGQPIQNLYLKFYPPNDARPSWGYTGEDGRFELEYAGDQKGAIVGVHTVTAEIKLKEPEYASKAAPNPEKQLIFEKYGKRETSKMTVEIKRNENLELKFD